MTEPVRDRAEGGAGCGAASARQLPLRLSGVVVCQDNQATIGPVLASLAPHCDELVVVDGGSRDGTVEIAAQHPKVRLFERPFDGSITRQKNFAMEQCRGRWILVLDTDELLGVQGVGRLRLLTHLPLWRWYALPRYWLVPHGAGLGYLAARPHYRDRQVRLFQNRPEFRYRDEAPIHHEFRRPLGPGRPLRRPHLFHYTFLLQDRARREAKVRRYLELDPRGAPIHRMYLYEDLALPVAPLVEPLPGRLDRGERNEPEA